MHFFLPFFLHLFLHLHYIEQGTYSRSMNSDVDQPIGEKLTRLHPSNDSPFICLVK